MFEVLVAANSKVKTGTPVIRVDRAIMTENKVDLTTPVVITNSDGFQVKHVAERGKVKKGTRIMTFI